MHTIVSLLLAFTAMAALVWWVVRRKGRGPAGAGSGVVTGGPQDVSMPLDGPTPDVGLWKPSHRRREVRDVRLLPKQGSAVPRGQRERLLDARDARRRFSTTLRSRDHRLSVLAVDPQQLERYGLPCWNDERELAAALELTVGQLRSLSMHRAAERRPNYVTFELPKRSGGMRRILAPKHRLKQVQRRLVALLVERLPVHDAAHGFRKARSIKTGAQMHVGKRVILTLDVREFFPSITFPRIRGYLVAMGYGYEVASTVAALCTEAQRQPVEVGGAWMHVPVGQRHAPQGAPSSPGFSNAICMRLDRRLLGVARSYGFAYSRYADDLTFSGDNTAAVGQLRARAIAVLRAEGFEPNPGKTRVLRRGRRQRVTGVTVNETLGLSRKERRRLRAELHQAGRGEHADVARLRGKLAYVRMLNSAQGAALEKQGRSGQPDAKPTR